MNSAYWLGLAGLLSSGLAAAEPPLAAADEPSLELLEFLADYGNDSGEIDLPAELDAINLPASNAPTSEQAAARVTPASPTGTGDPKP